MNEFLCLVFKEHFIALVNNEIVAFLPHHAWSEFWVLKFFDQTCYIFLIPFWQHRVNNGFKKRQVFYSLCCPVGLKLSSRNSPNFLCVGFKEFPIESPSKATRSPSLKMSLIFWWIYANPNIGENAKN